jgi:hypothetical protein
MPVTIPVELPTVATVISLLLHVPPVVLSANAVTEPTQPAVGPVIAATVGGALAVSVLVTLLVQPGPLVAEYVITEVPAATEVTTPVTGSIVITDVLPDAHVPPATLFANVTVPGTHTPVGPVIAPNAGAALTVLVVVAKPAHPALLTV